MNGPSHYIEAERLTRCARDMHHDHYDDSPAAAMRLAEAQVHATLALAAATALSGVAGIGPREAWIDAVEGTPGGAA